LDRRLDQLDPVTCRKDETEEFATREVVLAKPSEPTRGQITANGAFVVVVQTSVPERGRIKYRPGQQMRAVLRGPVGQHLVDIQRAFVIGAQKFAVGNGNRGFAAERECGADPFDCVQSARGV